MVRLRFSLRLRPCWTVILNSLLVDSASNTRETYLVSRRSFPDSFERLTFYVSLFTDNLFEQPLRENALLRLGCNYSINSRLQ